MIDTHTHLYSEQFDEDRDEAIKRAKEAGVEKFYLPAIDSETHMKKCWNWKANILMKFLQ